MAKSKRNKKSSKPSVKVEDITPQKDAKGGGDRVYKEQKADGTLGGSVKLGYNWNKQTKI